MKELLVLREFEIHRDPRRRSVSSRTGVHDNGTFNVIIPVYGIHRDREPHNTAAVILNFAEYRCIKLPSSFAEGLAFVFEATDDLEIHVMQITGTYIESRHCF